MKRFLLVVLSVLVCSLSYSQVIGYSYTIKLGSNNNELNVYAIPNGSGSVKWQQINIVVGFKDGSPQPGQGTFAPNDNLFGTYSIVTPWTGSDGGYTYTNWGTNLGSPSNWVPVTNGTEYLVGTITYPVSVGGYVPYLLDFADNGSYPWFGNTFLVEGGTNEYFYPTNPANRNSEFYAASGGGYLNSGSMVVENSADVWAVTPTLKLLPLKLLSFTAKQSNSAGLLNWTVSEQQNTASFIVERSADGKNYSKIGTVAAAGNYAGKQDYTFTDANAQNGTNYYRLKMVDIDGRFTYSPLKTVSFDANALSLQITPNPAQSICYVKGLTQPAVVKLLDVNGKVLSVQNGVTSTSPINVASLARALYFVQVIQNGQILNTLKLIKE
ncbi:T9SS type A sorting domain-containing protein [Chitinophagaceae bacterium 26-R-25]|nr:T9SS type A sorting domain-containing protein [Chitinophagaceae bacterium 26-R-25]